MRIHVLFNLLEVLNNYFKGEKCIEILLHILCSIFEVLLKQE